MTWHVKRLMLSEKDKEHFIEHGYVFLRNAIPQDFIKEWWKPREAFLRAARWESDDSHLFFPARRRFNVQEKMPEVDSVINQLVGGEDRIAGEKLWGDGFVVAMPQEEVDFEPLAFEEKYRWHKDGFFTHYLDSPEKGLICLLFWTEVTSENGGTAIAKGSVKIIAEQLAAHPEGLPPHYYDENLFSPDESAQVRLTGKAGDVCFMHPFLIHAFRPNLSNSFRAVTNPSIALKEPMRFNRKNQSPVEQAILRALGKKKLKFAPTGERYTATVSFLTDKLTRMRNDLNRRISVFENGFKP